jgi:hypothetical protein
MLLSRAAIADVADVVKADDFYKPAHELVFAAILDLYGRGVPSDAVTVAAELTKRGELGRIGGAPYLHTLMSSPPTAANAGYYAEIVRDRAIRRRGMQEAQSFCAALDPAKTQPEDLEAVLARYADKVAALLPSSRDPLERTPHLAEVPEYPVDAIPGPLGALVKAGLRRGLDPAMVGGAGLGALSATSGGARVEVRSGQKPEPVALWIPLCGEPGAGKSPAMHMAFGPVYELEEEAYEQYEQDLESWEMAPAKDRGPRPVNLCRISDDVTLEAVARWLKVTGGHGGLVPDELTGWIGSIGRYRAGSSDGGEHARHLSLWDGSPWKFQRVTQGVDIRIHNPSLAVCGGIQPANFPLLGPEADGMRPRWLPHLSRDGVTEWKGAGDTGAWKDAITRLYRSTGARLWRLDPAALKALNIATAGWRRRAQEPSSNPSVTAAARKGDRQATRIALALAESLNPGAEQGEVSCVEMDAAIALVDYALDCWNAMPGSTALTFSRREETLSGGVDELAAWLEAHGGLADRRALQRSKVAGARTAAALSALLAEYEAVYPGSVTQDRVNKSGPLTTVVCAPRRGPGRVPDSSSTAPAATVDGDSSPQGKRGRSVRETAAHSAAELSTATVDAVDSSHVNSSLATVPGTLSTPGQDDGEWSA